MVSDVRVRPALQADMANDLNDHVGVHGRPFTPERIRADGFGPRAAFTPLIAEIDGGVASAGGADVRILGLDGERLRATASGAP